MPPSLNALRHGGRSKQIIVGDEKQEDFDRLSAAWKAELRGGRAGRRVAAATGDPADSERVEELVLARFSSERKGATGMRKVGLVEQWEVTGKSGVIPMPDCVR